MSTDFADALSFFISVAFLLSVRIPERHVAMQAEGAESIPLVRVGKAEGTPLAIAEMTEGTAALQVEAVAASESGRGFRGVIADVLEGLVYVRSSPWLWVTIIGAARGNIGITASLDVAMPKLVHDVYGQGPWLLGLLSTATAIGSIAALLSISQATHLKKRGLLAYLSLSLPAIGMVLFGLPFPRSEAPIIASLASMLVGFGLAFFNTIWFTVLHETIPSNKLGRVSSLDSLGSFAMVPIGEGLGGVMTDHIGPAQVFLVFGLFNLILNLIPLLIKEIRRME